MRHRLRCSKAPFRLRITTAFYTITKVEQAQCKQFNRDSTDPEKLLKIVARSYRNNVKRL